MAPTRTTRASVRNDPAHVHCSLTPDRKPRAKKRRKSFFNLTGQGKISSLTTLIWRIQDAIHMIEETVH